MHCKSLMAAAVLAGVVIAPSSALAARGFSYGVSAAEVTSRSALVWAHPDKAGRYSVEVATDRRFRHDAKKRRVTATRRSDLTVQKRFRGLKPGKRYYYRFSGNRRRSDVGTFRTAPSDNANATIRFAYSGDADAQRAAGQSNPFWGNFAVYGQMARQHNHFNVNLGDTIYSDSEVPGQGTPALHAVREVRQVQAEPGAQEPPARARLEWRLQRVGRPRVRQRLHEGGGRQHRLPHRREGVPHLHARELPVGHRPLPQLPLGQDVEVFFLDERSFRSAKASANHVCDNPSTARRTTRPPRRSPRARRSPCSTRSSASRCPRSAPPTINDPGRTMLGRSQLALFKRAVRNSSATWKVIMNEVQIEQFYALPYDRWEGTRPSVRTCSRSSRRT